MATTDGATEARNKACISRQWEEIWNQGVVDAIGAYYAAEFRNFGMPTNPDHLRRIVHAWRTAFPDLHYTVDALLAEADQVVSQCTLSGTQHGPLPLRGWALLPVTGQQFTVQQIHRFRLRDGKIVEHWAVRDDLAMLEQLGHIAPPATR